MNLTAHQLETAQQIRVVVGKLSRLLRPTEAGSAANLTPTKVAVLLATTRRERVRISEVAASVGLNPTMLSRTIGQLVEAGLVERSSDESDRRAGWLCSTAEGRALAEHMRRERTEAVEGAMAALEDADRKLIDAALPALERLAHALGERRV